MEDRWRHVHLGNMLAGIEIIRVGGVNAEQVTCGYRTDGDGIRYQILFGI
jgi:hypothetical protein